MRPLAQHDLTVLFAFWYDLEVLRAGVFASAPPDDQPEAWIQRYTGVDGWVIEADSIVGGLLYQPARPCVTVEQLIVDIHTQHRAVAAKLWQTALAAWHEQGCCCVRASAVRRLPVEQAFWRACGATLDGKEYEVSLC